MLRRRRAREIALQVLYGLDTTGGDVAEKIDLFWSLHPPPDPFIDKEEEMAVRKFSTELVNGVWKYRREIDEIISGCSENWALHRMSRVDRSILRMAVFELLYCNDIPPKVSINEAIDLGKQYGSENSGAFINGILDTIYNRRQAQV